MNPSSGLAQRTTPSRAWRNGMMPIMEWAELALQYVEALVWPIVVAVVVYAFREPIAAKIESLTGVRTVIGDAEFERDAKQVEEKVDRAAAREDAKAAPPPADTTSDASHEASLSVDSDGRLTEQQEAEIRESSEAQAQAWERERRAFWAVSAAAAELNNPSGFSTARDVAAASPEAAVLLAYEQLEKVARAAVTINDMGSFTPPFSLVAAIERLTNGDPNHDFVEATRALVDLRNRVAHGAGNVSTAGALNYISAGERLAESVSRQALSRLRHPSRSQVLRQWAEWHGSIDPETGVTTADPTY